MQSIGIIGGTGKQGSALARRLVTANFPVLIGSRSQSRGMSTAEKLNEEWQTDLITGGDNQYAAGADIVVLAIPFDQVDPLVTPLSDLLDNKIVIDMTVNLKFGKFVSTDLIDGKSGYEYIRNLFPDSKVVMCLKTISFVKLGSDEPLSQTDFQMTLSDEAFAFTSELVSKFGLTPLRVRGRTHAHTIERMVALSIQLNKEYSGSHAGFLVTDLKM